MLNSFLFLFKAPYNKKHPAFALWRFLIWKSIKLLRLREVKYKFWGNKYLYLNYDSFQSMWLMYNYVVDWEEFNIISRYTKPNDHVADIGANMGFYSIWMSKFVSASGKIHSFEPDENNYSRLKKNIVVNNLQNIILPNNMAVSDLVGKLNFTTGLDGENHIAQQSLQETTQVDSLRLDTYAKQHQISHFTYVKIDVEGFECNVLKGAHQLLTNKQIQVIQLEINKTIKNSGASIDELLELLRKYSYVICKYDVETNSLIPIEYSEGRENYFAVYDLLLANQKLQKL